MFFVFLDPCRHHKCGPGRECEINEDGKADCVCVKKCPEEVDSRRKVTALAKNKQNEFVS